MGRRPVELAGASLSATRVQGRSSQQGSHCPLACGTGPPGGMASVPRHLRACPHTCQRPREGVGLPLGLSWPLTPEGLAGSLALRLTDLHSGLWLPPF